MAIQPLGRITALWIVGTLACVSVGWSAPANIATTVRSDWTEAQLKETSSEGRELNVEQGSRIALRIAGSLPMHVAVLLQDPSGRVRAMVPKRGDQLDRLVPGMELLVPDMTAGEVLYADMPTGRGNIYLIGSERPAFSDPKWTAGDPAPWWQVENVIDQLNSPAVGRKRITRIPLYVRGAVVKEYISTEEFVEFYDVGTRSVSGADRGFRIGFTLNSAELDSFSRRQLDAVGRGMRDERLGAFRFEIEGHTDDRGGPDYNKDLSIRRASAVREYLAQRTGVSQTRLSARGYGFERPQVDGDTDEARAQNRRVVIRRLDVGSR